MAHSHEELKKMTVAEMRKVAEGIEHEALHGYTTMHKEQLLPALCAALGIEAHVHHVAARADKTRIKAQIRELKAQRDAAIAAHDRKPLARIRHRIHNLKRMLRRAAV